MAVDPRQRLNRFLGFPTNQHPIGILQISDRRALRQKLRIREHREALARRSSLQNRLHRLGRAHRQGALLHHDRVASGRLCQHARGCLDPLEITCLPCPHTVGLGGGVHGDEHHVGGRDRPLHRGGEVQVATPRPAHHLIEPGFIDRQQTEIGGVPGPNPLLVEVHHRDLDVGAAIGHHGHCWATHIAGTNAANAANCWCAHDSWWQDSPETIAHSRRKQT